MEILKIVYNEDTNVFQIFVVEPATPKLIDVKLTFD